MHSMALLNGISYGYANNQYPTADILMSMSPQMCQLLSHSLLMNLIGDTTL